MLKGILAAAILWAPIPQEKGDLSGRVSFPADAKTRAKPKVHYPDQASHQALKDPPYSPALLYLEGVPAGPKGEGVVEIKQEGLQFRPRALVIQRGMRISFPNLDKEYHNVFSYSKAKRFDLGRYPEGETREVVFEEPGLVRIYCEIHEHMRAYVQVVDHPYYAVAAEDGSFTIKGVPPGAYTLVAWHERFEPLRRKIDVPAGGLKLDLSFSRADQGPEPAVRALGCCETSRGASGP